MFKDDSLWGKMKRMAKEFEEQDKRIDQKKKILHDNGVNVDTSHIQKPKDQLNDKNKDKKDSMWEKMLTLEEILDARREYQDKLEAAYDKAIIDILGSEFLPKPENEDPKKGKKGLRGRLKRSDKKVR
jgi:hypothetical protein